MKNPEVVSGQELGSGSDLGQRANLRGVRKRKWGKWVAEIKNPFDGKRVWLGTFDSEEAASRAYDSKKQEFERIAKAKQGIKRKTAAILPVGVRVSKKTGKYYSLLPNQIGNKKECFGPFETVEEALQVYQSKKQEFEESKVGDVQSSDSCSNGGEDDGGMLLAQWVSMRDGSEVSFSVKYGIPIIDNYGLFLGEFRRLDDDLWICRPGDDDYQPSHI